MGYTHYFRRKSALDKKTFNKFAEDVRVIFEAAKKKRITLVGPYGQKDTLPIAIEGMISFNGLDKNSHETMYIPRLLKRKSYDDKNELIFDFCKTARKPYDLIVVAVLVAFKHHFPHAEISSDGDNEDFEAGKNLCVKLFGYGLDFKLRED
jgi:hypothetical protein